MGILNRCKLIARRTGLSQLAMMSMHTTTWLLSLPLVYASSINDPRTNASAQSAAQWAGVAQLQEPQQAAGMGGGADCAHPSHTVYRPHPSSIVTLPYYVVERSRAECTMQVPYRFPSPYSSDSPERTMTFDSALNASRSRPRVASSIIGSFPCADALVRSTTAFSMPV